MPWWKPANFLYWITLYLLGGLVLFSNAQAQDASVLAQGSWYKIGVVQSGIYRLDAPALRRLGLTTSTLNARHLQLYGNGGGMLPQANDALRPQDLRQNAIWVPGEEDGRFDEQDALYFYAEGPHVTRYDSLNHHLYHQTNYYSDTSYYFLTVGTSPGLRLTDLPSLMASQSTPLDQFDDYWFHEKESVNLLQSGREWWGEYLANTGALNLQVPTPGLVPGSMTRLRVRAIASAQVPTQFRWQVNGQEVGRPSVGTVSTYRYDLRAQLSDQAYVFPVGTSPPVTTTLSVAFDPNGQSSAQAYLDWASLQTKRYLRPYDGQQSYYFLPASVDTVTYRITGTLPDWYWWDVSDPARPARAQVDRGPDGTGTFTAIQGRRFRRFIGFRPSQALEPVSGRAIANQNIRQSKVPDLLIVTPPAWETQARRLADFREQHDGLDVLVVTSEQVYHEFGSGQPDISALRDLARYLYLRAPDKLRYLLLFGDASYDYKNRTAAGGGVGVPVYQSRESLHPVFSYSSDDYFGFFKTREGTWEESTSGDHTLDIGVGRLPVKTPEEARVVVDKLIHYATSPRSRGAWRNRISFVADDGDANIHQQHADQLATFIQPHLLSQRLFIDAFPQQTTPGGTKAPELNTAIRRTVEEGTLILNYTGHGGAVGWAEEQVLTLADMQAMRGYNNLPLLVTATCEFGRYDDPALVSGAELMVLSPRGAAIGAVTTTRPVFASTNFTLNKAFYEALAVARPQQLRLGDIVRLTKNNSLSGSLNRNFALLGDPSLRLAQAEHAIRWRQVPDTLRALQKVLLEGEIVAPGAEVPLLDFNGSAQVVVYDKPVAFRTLGNEATAAEYQEYRNRLFAGNVQVQQGRFRVEFVVPRDIDYRLGEGRVSVYALSQDSLTDASAQLAVWVGGSANVPPDRTPPTLTAYLNDAAFQDGQTVTPTPVLYAELFDESGINLSQAGLGHDLTATLNDTLSWVLNAYYTAHPNDFRSGTIRFPLGTLPPGPHQLRIKVWDTHTNSAEKTLRFIVGSEPAIKLAQALVFPNPFEQHLSFKIEHTRESEDVEITFRLFNVAGQTLKTFHRMYYNSEAIIEDAIPNLVPSQLLTPGRALYLYELLIRSSKDNSTDRHTGKLLRMD
ncbi:type IX secretion system sortase PorU [Rhabdobacter roseus]|uniref:Gingipain domain-containing protein n=1 Tax=Rhabdobacter roseus TaxID=1655419 RepID=A0A840TFR3_9BACT|nr:type IX secretion system sortase PorU [Rhabdobacter roseus]MBB5282011.1 hypothetical protein [Rhabdobacter roseus]